MTVVQTRAFVAVTLQEVQSPSSQMIIFRANSFVPTLDVYATTGMPSSG